MGYLSHLIGPVLEADDPYVSPWKSPTVTNPYGACNKVEILDDSESGLTDDEINLIKTKVFEDNAIAISICYSDGLYLDDSGNLCYDDDYNFFNNYISGNYIYYNKMLSYYCNKNYASNHCVTVVGWDDTYSKSNFKTKPSGNGAFLIKNSYGTDYHDNGYFWLSYYDKTINEVVSYDFISPEDKKYNKIYTPNNSCPLASTGYDYFYINYEFKEAGSITGIQVYSFIGGVTYQIKITDADNNTLCTQSQKIPYSGYNTIMLNTPIKYKSGETYFVI